MLWSTKTDVILYKDRCYVVQDRCYVEQRQMLYCTKTDVILYKDRCYIVQRQMLCWTKTDVMLYKDRCYIVQRQMLCCTKKDVMLYNDRCCAKDRCYVVQRRMLCCVKTDVMIYRQMLLNVGAVAGQKWCQIPIIWGHLLYKQTFWLGWGIETNIANITSRVSYVCWHAMFGVQMEETSLHEPHKSDDRLCLVCRGRRHGIMSLISLMTGCASCAEGGDMASWAS